MYGFNAPGAGFAVVKSGLDQVTFNNAGPAKGPKNKGIRSLNRWANRTAKGRAGLKRSKVNARSSGPTGPKRLSTEGVAKGANASKVRIRKQRTFRRHKKNK